MMKRVRISEKDIKLLWGRSGNRCSMPNCKTQLSKDEGQGIVIGHMAHIRGEKESAARWDPGLSPRERNSYANRILLCPNHHSEIDKNEAKYTIDYLLKIKTEHEALYAGSKELSDDDSKEPRVSSLFREHALDLIIENGAYYQDKLRPFPSLPIKQIIEEPLQDKPMDFSSPILIYGPPNVGKTCWTIRQAWHWLKDKGPNANVFLLNAIRDKPEYLIKLVEDLVPEVEVLYIVDDIHFAYFDLETWESSLNHAMKDRGSHVHVVWITRDRSIASKFVEEPEPFPFPIERVLKLYTIQLKHYLPWQRVIAVFETGLDPFLARVIKNWRFPITQELSKDSFVDFTTWLEKKVKEYTRNRLTNLEKFLERAAYNTYLTLLPFGSISRPLEIEFLNQTSIPSDIDIEAIIDAGLASRSNRDDEDRIALTEHPFQIGQALRALKGMIANSFAQDLLRKRFPRCPDTNLPETIFALYLSQKLTFPEFRKSVEDLGNFAEWSGIVEPFAKALQILLGFDDWEDNREVKNSITVWCRKLTRKSYPDDKLGDDAEQQQLRQALNIDHIELKRECSIAESAEKRKSGNNRLDYILYEIGFLDYFQGRYDEAAIMFSRSVQTGLDTIKRGMYAGPQKTEEWRDGSYALANIWISGALMHIAILRSRLRQAIITGKDSYRTFSEDVNYHINQLDSIHQKLFIANRAPQEDSAILYSKALQTLCPTWQPPDGGQPIPRSSKIPGMNEALARHERNVWLHAIEASCLPVLYGIYSRRVHTNLPSPDEEYEITLPLPAPVIGLPLARQQKVEALYHWTEKSKNRVKLEEETLCAAALMRASGNLEGLGDAVLLAWRCASLEKVDALSWYLQHRIPDLGCNDISKLALKALNNQ